MLLGDGGSQWAICFLENVKVSASLRRLVGARPSSCSTVRPGSKLCSSERGKDLTTELRVLPGPREHTVSTQYMIHMGPHIPIVFQIILLSGTQGYRYDATTNKGGNWGWYNWRDYTCSPSTFNQWVLNTFQTLYAARWELFWKGGSAFHLFLKSRGRGSWNIKVNRDWRCHSTLPLPGSGHISNSTARNPEWPSKCARMQLRQKSIPVNEPSAEVTEIFFKLCSETSQKRHLIHSSGWRQNRIQWINMFR